MRFVCRSLLLIAMLIASARAQGQVTPQPELLPPPGPTLAAPGEDVAPISVPWLPPVGTSPPPAMASAPSTNLLEESLPAPAAGETIDGMAGEAAAAAIAEGEPPTWYQRAFLLVPAPWDTGIELGLNGSAGTSDSFSMRTGGYTKRASKFSKLDTSVYYNRTGSDGIVSQNNAQFDFRNDWLLDEKSPWTLFATNSVFYDQFKDFNVQTNIDTGVGYRVFHEKELQLIGRVGGGTSREFGGVDDRWVPEGLFGFEYNQQLNATQKCYAKADYFPELDKVGEFRLVADVGWEVVLVQPSNLSLKISAQDRYDSTPNGGEPQLLNYSVLLLLKL